MLRNPHPLHIYLLSYSATATIVCHLSLIWIISSNTTTTSTTTIYTRVIHLPLLTLLFVAPISVFTNIPTLVVSHHIPITATVSSSLSLTTAIITAIHTRPMALPILTLTFLAPYLYLYDHTHANCQSSYPCRCHHLYLSFTH